MAGPVGPMWFDPAPPDYPWSLVKVRTDITTAEEAERVVDQIKEAGNQDQRQEDHYNALWKYTHALVLSRDHKLSPQIVSVLRSNSAQACLCLKYYSDAYYNANDAIMNDPYSPIIHKAFYRRAEASKLLYDTLQKKYKAPDLALDGIKEAIQDYWHCFFLKETNIRAACEAVILSVNYSVVVPMVFMERDIECGATTKILQELLTRDDTKHTHLMFLMHRIPFRTLNPRRFDCSSLQFSVVCRKTLKKSVLVTMFTHGLSVSPEDIATAVEVLPDTKSTTLDLIVGKCRGTPPQSLAPAYATAEKLKKRQLVQCLKKHGAVPAQEKVLKFKAEGNECYQAAKYDEALAWYYKALALCQQHRLEEEEALIRGNCAQACLLLELYKDAFEHAHECLRLDPESSKGYYRRAESLRRMLEDRRWRKRVPERRSYKDVVQDYFQCHRKTENWNLKALFQAMCVAIKHDCTKSLPRLTPEEVASGLPTKILVELVQREDTEQTHFSLLLFTLLSEDSGSESVDVSSVQLTELMKKKSVTSARLIQRLVSLGMKVNETDVSSAVEILGEQHQKKVIDLLAKESVKTRSSTFTSACKEAIKAKKLKFVACLIENGGEPDVEDLKEVTGWPRGKVNPVIDGYLRDQTKKKKERELMEGDAASGLPDPATALATARQALEMGEQLGHLNPFLAEQKFREALAVCAVYHFYEEMGEVYQRLGQLHLNIRRYDTAFQHCCEGLQCYPSAKMYFLRATVLQKALSAPMVTVPRAIQPSIVVSDYCSSHRLQDNIRALTEAIIFAVDHRLSSALKDRKKEPLMDNKHVRSGFTTNLLLELLRHDRVKEAHVKLLLLDIPIHHANKPHFDGSRVSLSVLLKRRITHSKILNALLESGMKVRETDVRLAVENLAGDTGGATTLDLLCSRLKDATLNSVCEAAMGHKKVRFVLCLLRKGCTLPCTSQEILTLALEKNSADVAESLLPFCSLPEVDLGRLMNTRGDLGNHRSLVVKMIDGGVNPGGLGDYRPLAEVLKMTVTVGKKVELMCVLLERGCDCNQMCGASEWTTTPVHVAVTIGVDAGGSTRVLDAVVASKTFCVDSYVPFIDGRGNTPLHLAVNSVKKEHSFKLLKALIETHELPIDPHIRDKHGKKVFDLILGKKDKRLPFLSTAATRVQQSAKSKKQKKKQKENGAKEEEEVTVESGSTADMEKSDSTEVAESEKEPTQKPVKRLNSYEVMSVNEKLELHMKVVLGKGDEYFVPATEQKVEIAQVENGGVSKETEFEHSENDAPTEGVESLGPTTAAAAARKSASPQPPAVTEEREGDMNTVMSRYGLEEFDGLPWEVEVTNNVLKFFKNEKDHPYSLRLRAARTVYELAEGKRGRELSKELSSSTSNLFEAKLSKGGRIIWQVAVQFSPRRTEAHRNPIYAQVVRVWEIVPDHDQLAQTIKRCVKEIERSDERGMKASLNVPLIPAKGSKQKKKKQKQSVRQQEKLQIPKIFTQVDVEEAAAGGEIERYMYTPAASPKEDEFNVTTFYSFSGAVLKSMLTGSNMRRDFPFKEWPKEHEIINLPQDTESILLLGRSGTGKTTCCLYRLWNEFKAYWDRPTVVRLPRKPLVTVRLPSTGENEGEDEGADSIDEDPNETTDTAVANTPNHVVCETPVPARTNSWGERKTSEEEEEERGGECDSELSDDAVDAEDGSCDDEVEEVEEHLHQVFVTKNYVLCAQMKRRFYDMAAAHDFLDQHMDWETRELPHSFAEIDDLSYPLFLTARQFYVLLDNSIGDEQCFFRPRERDGGLRVKIVSSDYDHEDPDTLLDLEDSESEGEDPAAPGDHPLPSAPKHLTQLKYVEVTALYFADRIWPDISRKCGARHLDPLLVWLEIQSYIKGSRTALMRGEALLLEQYRQIGNKMAPNFAGERETIYGLYRRYEEHCQNRRHSVFLFDECDLVQDLHRRLRSVRDLSWSIHSLYIDEVQDFTQAELALYLHCCRHPNSLFFTGDTAQSIMRGVAFRFQDLRSSFHAIHEVVPRVKVPQQPHTLTINFRSHSGILHLAGSIIDLLQTFFKGSIDHLPADRGMFSGPTPVLLASCEESDLALLLSSSRRESSRIEFGAHQVVLVQSKEAKDNLPSILKGAIVLTIFESKGLEFDDVLLYNFFHDSMVDEKGWRVVTAYLEDYAECIKVNRRLPGSNSDPRSNKFDERSHKALNSELKYLYTAVTRAKCNLWIYDSDPKKKLPMFDLWYKRDLVKVVGEGVEGMESQHSLIFASISTEHQWKVQGDYFMRRSRWEQARHCYDRAGEENVHLSVEAEARFVVQQASKLAKPQLYLEAAVRFLHRDQLVHSVQCLLFAAQCLRRSKPQRFSSAAVLFEHLGKFGEALKCYRKVKDTRNCVRLLERENRYDEAVRMFRSPKEALAKAVEYTAKGIELTAELLPDNLSYVYASQCAKHRDTTMLVEMLSYMSDASRRARFLKISGLYREALTEYVNNDELDDAYRLASGQCLYSAGREIAKTHDDPKREAEFSFHQIHSELMKSREKGTPFPSKFETDLHNMKKSTHQMVKAHACLLLGMVTKDAALCRSAHVMFLRVNKAAALEAFDAQTSLPSERKPDLDRVLVACATAREVQRALQTTGDLHQLVNQATAFYGVQRVSDVYLATPGHNVWVSAKLKALCLVKSGEERDIDGMLRLNVASTREVLAAHVGFFVDKWLNQFGTETIILRRMTSFKLHDTIQKKKYLLRMCTQNEVPKLMDYVFAVINHCRLGMILSNNKTCNSAVSTLLAMFSPQVSLHLPLTEQHLVAVRKATPIHKRFHETVKLHLSSHNYLNRMDEWFTAWRACCISDANTKLVDTALQKLEEEVNSQCKKKPESSSTDEKSSVGYWKKGRFQPPCAYLYWKNEVQYYHIFSCWLYSCSVIREEKKPLWAAKQAIHHFLGTITQRKSLSISVMNLVYVLIVHCTGLFATLTQLNHQQDKMSAKFVVPVQYPGCVTLFDQLNCNKDDCTLLSASTSQAKRAFKKWDQSLRLREDCCKLLGTALDILLGTYRKDTSLPPEEQKTFKVLRYAFRNDKIVTSGAAGHCLVLSLTLFANLLHYQQQHKWEAQRRRFVSFFDEMSNQESSPRIMKEGREVFNTPLAATLQGKVIQYVGQLLREVCVKGTPTQALMMINDKGRITYAPLPSGPAPGTPLHNQQSSVPIASTAHPSGSSVQQKQSSKPEFPLQPRHTSPQSQLEKGAHSNTATMAVPHTANVSMAPAVGQEGLLQTPPVPATAHTPAGHSVYQPPQETVSANTPLVQPSRRKWENLPPILEGLLQPPNTQTPPPPPPVSTAALNPLVQTTWEGGPYHNMTEPLSLQQAQMQQPTYASMQQQVNVTGTSVSASHVFDPQQSGSVPVAPLEASLVPDPIWGYPQPFNPATLTAGHQLGGGGGATEQLPWPTFPMYQQQSTALDPSHETYYPMQQQALGHSGALPQTAENPYLQYDWDPFTGTYHQLPVDQLAVYYGNQYEHSADVQSYTTEPSTVPLHTPLSSQVSQFGQDTSRASAVPPTSTTYTPPPHTVPVSSYLQTTDSLVAESAHQVEPPPLHSAIAPPTSSLHPSQDLDLAQTSVSLPETDFDETVQQQQEPTTQLHEPSVRFEYSESSVPAVEQAESLETPEIEGDIVEGEREEEEERGGEEEEEEEDDEEREDFEEMEDEDRTPRMSAFRKSVWTNLPTVDPDLVDPSIVAEECCNICGVGLRSRDAAGASEEPGEGEGDVEDLEESYDSHVRSDVHARNFALHKSFRERFEEFYSGMAEELSDLMHMCELTQAPSLTRTTDDMRDTLDKYERRMAEIQTTLNWKQGLGLVDTASDMFHQLLTRGNREYERFKSDNPLYVTEPGPRRGGGEGENAGDSDSEFHASLNKVEADEDDEMLKLRSETGKHQSRARKKNKKKKQ